MKRTQRIIKIFSTFWKHIIRFFQWVSRKFKSLPISNWLSFFAAILGFLGTFIIVMDKFEPIHRRIDKFQKWKNISIALQDLDTFDTKFKSKEKLGAVMFDEQGFSELVDIIISKRSDIKNKNIICIAKNEPINIAGVPYKVVHILFENNNHGVSLTTEYIFNEWVRDYREKYFLKIGLILIGLGFLIGILGHIKRKKIIT